MSRTPKLILLFRDLLILGSEVLFRMSHSCLFSWCTENIQSSITSAKLSFFKVQFVLIVLSIHRLWTAMAAIHKHARKNCYRLFRQLFEATFMPEECADAVVCLWKPQSFQQGQTTAPGKGRCAFKYSLHILVL